MIYTYTLLEGSPSKRCPHLLRNWMGYLQFLVSWVLSYIYSISYQSWQSIDACITRPINTPPFSLRLPWSSFMAMLVTCLKLVNPSILAVLIAVKMLLSNFQYHESIVCPLFRASILIFIHWELFFHFIVSNVRNLQSYFHHL